MKNKSTRHKDLNTFKFIPFSARISNIDVDVFHRVEHEYESQEEGESYFYQTVDKWNVLNLTEGYTAFRKEIKPENYITLPQVVLGQESIVNVISKHLKEEGNSSYIQPLLEILVALAKDLQKEFYPYYPQFLQILIDLLDTKETEQIEWTFTCLAYLFKFLWRPLVKDFGVVFKALLPLLSDSKPEYINDFAAESFAFVARKVKDKKAFLEVLLRTVKHNRDGVSGCGKLLFHIINGVDRQFHSCAETLLPILFESLSESDLPQQMFHEILERLVENILSNIHPRKGAELYWKTLTDTCENLFEKRNFSTLELTLRYLGQSVEYESGKFLLEPARVVRILVNVLGEGVVPESIVLSLTQIGLLLLTTSGSGRISQEQTSLLIRKLLNVKYKNVLLYFVENICDHSSFEALILPSLLSWCVKNEFDSESFHVLVKVVLKKSAPCMNGVDLGKWTKYPIDFKEHNCLVAEKLMEMLKSPHGNVDDYICASICLPHLIKINPDTTFEVLNGNLESILKYDERSLIMLNVTLECLIHTVDVEKLVDMLRNKIIPFLLHDAGPSLSSLSVLSLCVTVLKEREEIVTLEFLMELHRVLEGNFNSPYHEIRLLTSHIYTIFEDLPCFRALKHTSDSDAPVQQPFKLFSIIYEEECIESQVHTYRDKLQKLEKLSYDKPQAIMCEQTPFRTVPLRFLCGSLYINFRYLWEPVVKIIATYAGMDVFWSVFGDELKRAGSRSQGGSGDVTLSSFELVNAQFLNERVIKRLQVHESKPPDFFNYRILLWKAMALFPNLAESKSRDVSDLLLNFMEKEYFRTNSEASPVFSIKVNDPPRDIDNDGDTSNAHISRKACTKTLLHKLQVFSQVRDPRSMYRQLELHKLYFDLLRHKDTLVQKCALDCLMAYKSKHLTPYKEHLYGLIDDKKFRHVMTVFKVDPDDGNITEEHREEVIPVIMQIVFSKMNVKTGLRTGGKSSSQSRRNFAFRFLAGCTEDEMLSFLNKTLKFYDKYLEMDPMSIAQTITLDKFVPPKRLLSTVNLLNVIFKEFGGLMGERVLDYLLKIVFVIGALIKSAFERAEQVHVGFMPLLKTVRTSCMWILTNFFKNFDKYRWSSDQIDQLFELFVWAPLEKLKIECVSNVTSLLQLIHVWGSNPRYFTLLTKHKGTYVLSELIDLLANPKCCDKVIETIETIIENLLTLSDDGAIQVSQLEPMILSDEGAPQVPQLVPETQSLDSSNYGSRMLLPHLPSIMEVFKTKLIAKGLNQRELLILSRLSEMVTDHSDHNEALLGLLLPVVRRKCKFTTPEDVVLKYYSTSLNLIKHIEHPERHLKEISPLFGETVYPSCRKVLCKILNVVGGDDDDDDFKIVIDLNAWDKRWVDQPDFETRHQAFKRVQEMEDVTLRFGVLVCYNCYFSIRSEKDLAVRENASYTLKKLAVKLIETHHHKHLDYVLNETFFPLIREGIKSTNNDDLRNESISLLGALARNCSGTHRVFKDLNTLTNDEDPEVDFFENLTHLQIHRHARALLKYSSTVRTTTTSFNPRTLTQFILPLTSHYLLKEKYSGKNSVVDAAIEAIAASCRVLPWHQYEGILRYYLEKLASSASFQKQLVKLIVAILDAFHFDLGKGIVEAETSTADENDEDGEKGSDEFIGEEDEGEKGEEGAVKVYDKVAVLCKSTSTRVIKTIQVVLLPMLNKCLAQLTHFENSHKINRKKTSVEQEEEDMLKVPISLAVVKLLQRLPKEILEENITSIFMKMCTFLKSRLESVRRVARETLQKIMVTLGPKYLPALLSEMSSLLNRGYQVHVLVFTVHGVLNSLKEHYQPKDMDKVLLTVLNLCTADLFGVLSEEKEISKIAIKTSEARHNKTYDTLQILSQYITDACLLDLILPIKRVVETTRSHKTVRKAERSLRFIYSGLVDNTFITTKSLLKFAYGVASESVPQLIPPKGPQELQESKLLHSAPQKGDCFLIQAVPNHRTAYRERNVKSASDVNAHVFVEFGLGMYLLLLKREKIKEVEDFVSYLDPFVGVLKKSLKSNHVKLNTLSLQCLSWVFKYDLPSLRVSVKSITRDIFIILHKYAAAGLSKGDNFDLIVAAFKAVSVLLRDVSYHVINVKQLKILLMYAERDVHDHDRQATAFGLLKAILSRKLNVPEIKDVMVKVSELSVTSELSHVRAQCRSVFHQFVMDYPLENALDDYVAFYLSQMGYELRHGRESAIEMVHMLINSFPLYVLKAHSGSFLISLGARLVNDDEPQLRKMAAECISSMLSKLPRGDRDPLFEIMLLWFKDKNKSHVQLAAQLCGLLVTIEKQDFKTRLPLLIPHLLRHLGIDRSPGKYVKVLLRGRDWKTDVIEADQAADHLLFQLLQLILKLSATCPEFLEEKELIDDLAINCRGLLNHPHDWVRLSAAQFIGYALTTVDAGGLSEIISKGGDGGWFLSSNPVDGLKGLTLDLCDQLRHGVKPELAEQVIKNLIFVAKVLEPLEQEKFPGLNLLWLTKRIRKIVNTEIVEDPSTVTLRTQVFKFIGGIFTALNLNHLIPLSHHLVAPLLREMLTTDEKNAPLRRLAKGVLNLIKMKLGLVEYTELVSKLQRSLTVKRAERKRARTQLAVTDPEVYAKRKIKRHERKKVAKKRRIDERKGAGTKKRDFKRRKVTDLEDNEVFAIADARGGRVRGEKLRGTFRANFVVRMEPEPIQVFDEATQKFLTVYVAKEVVQKCRADNSFAEALYAQIRDQEVEEGSVLEIQTELVERVPDVESDQWSKKDTLHLLKLYRIRSDVSPGAPKKKSFWNALSEELSERNVKKTPEQCIEKWKMLMKTYKGLSRRSGNFSYFKEVDDIIKSTTEATATMDSPEESETGIEIDSKGDGDAEPKEEWSKRYTEKFLEIIKQKGFKCSDDQSDRCWIDLSDELVKMNISKTPTECFKKWKHLGMEGKLKFSFNSYQELNKLSMDGDGRRGIKYSEDDDRLGLDSDCELEGTKDKSTSTGNSKSSNDNLKWTEYETLKLIDLYKRHRHKYGEFHVKGEFWNMLAAELDSDKDGNKCRNKLRNLIVGCTTSDGNKSKFAKVMKDVLDGVEEGDFSKNDKNKWTQTETTHLLTIMGSFPKDPTPDWSVISDRLSTEHQVDDKSPEDCKRRWTDLLSIYRTHKDLNLIPKRGGGAFVHFKTMDRILGSENGEDGPNDGYDCMCRQDLRVDKRKRHHERMEVVRRKLDIEERKVAAFEEYLKLLKQKQV